MTRHTSSLPLAALCGLGLLAARPAHAHFLWADITRAPQPALRLTFGEDGADPTTARLLPKIQDVKAWTGNGSVLTLTPGTDAQTSPVPTAQHVVAAEKTWGIYDASTQGLGVFLLHYYAKAADDTASAATTARLPVEVFAHRQAGQIVAQVTRNGKPAPEAEVWVEMPGAAAPAILKTDTHGEVTFAVQTVGECRLRAMVAEIHSGDYEGRKYTLVRHYSTLTFPIEAAAETSETTPALKAGDGKADPVAFALLKGAHDSRQTLASDFPA